MVPPHNHTSNIHMFLPKSSLYFPAFMLSFPDGGSHSIQLDVLPPPLLSHKLMDAILVLRHNLHKHCDLASLHLTSYVCKRESWEKNALWTRGFSLSLCDLLSTMGSCRHTTSLSSPNARSTHGQLLFQQEPRASLRFEESVCFSPWDIAS